MAPCEPFIKSFNLYISVYQYSIDMQEPLFLLQTLVEQELENSKEIKKCKQLT